MQKYPREGGYKEHYYAAVEEDYVFKDECNFNDNNRVPSMHLMKQQPDPHYNHNYNYDQMHYGYNGGHNDHHKKDRESYAAHSADYWPPEDYRSGHKKKDYFGHGGKHHNAHEYTHNPGMKHNGYGVHEGHYGPQREHYQVSEYREERNMMPPVWEFRGIRD